MNKSKKSIFIVTASVFALALLILFFIFVSKKSVVAFYGLNSREENGIISAISKIDSDGFNSKKIKYLTFNPEISLETQVKEAKPAVLFSTSGASLSSLLSSAKGINVEQEISSSFSKLSSSMQGLIVSTSEKDRTVLKSIPVVSNNYEIDINMKFYRELGIKSISTWSDIENFVKKSLNSYGAGVFVDFANNDSTLDFFGAVEEALSGRHIYNKAVKILNDMAESNNFSGEKTLQRLLDEKCFSNTIKMLSNWYKENLFTPGTFNASTEDFSGFLANGKVSIAFMTLSVHRNIPRNVIENYASIYVPSMIPSSSRTFTAPSVCLVPLKNTKITSQIVKQSLTETTQKDMAAFTGLAPVFTKCDTQDRQADDARYWIASTNSPFSGLSKDTNLSSEQKNLLAKSLISAIRK